MNLDLHIVIFYAIAAVAVVVWLCALQFVLRTQRSAATPSELWEDEGESLGESDGTAVQGSAEVDGQPGELAAKAASILAQQGVTTIGPVKVMEQTDQRVVFEAMPHLGGRFLQRGILEFQALPGDRTRVDYTVLIPRRHGLLVGAWIFQALGLIALVVGFAVIQTWLASHPNPAVHWQSVQMVHVVHFLWPPFLFAGIFRRVRSHVRTTFDSLVHNLPYVKG